MKKIILVLAISIALFSCQKNSEQIEAAKQKLKSRNYAEKEIESTKYDVVEIMDKDAYSILYDKKNKAILETISAGGDYKEMENDSKKLAKNIQESKGEKIFYKVHFYRIVDKDTVSENVLFLDDKNQEIGFEYLK